MTRLPTPGPAAAKPVGPYETEAQARAVAAVRAVYASQPATGQWQPLTHRMLCEALSAAGVEVGAYDHRIIWWLAGWEPQTVAVIAGLIARAYTAGRQRPARRDGHPRLSDAETPLVLDALATAADHRRDLVDVCGECPHTEGGLCATCDRWMTTIDEYESLADELRERRQ